MISRLFILMCIYVTSPINAQDICLRLDSIECYRVPWRLKTVRNIYKDEIIYNEAIYGRTSIVVSDNKALQHFVTINIGNDTSQILFKEVLLNDFDARTVIVRCYNNGLKDTIVLNNKGLYHYNQTVFKSDIQLLLWLVKYSPLFELDNELILIKEED